MLTRGQDAIDRSKSRMMAPTFLRIEGQLKSYPDSDGAVVETYGNNLCVWKGFACGMNIRVPDVLEECFVPRNPAIPSPWRFLDSTSCDETKGYPPFYVVVYRVCSSPACTSDASNAGFIEIVEVELPPKMIPFATFTSQVMLENAKLGIDSSCLTSGACSGRYHAMTGRSGSNIEFNLLGHQGNSSRSGIESVDGQPEKNIDEWQFAEGDVIHASGNGIVKITNSRLSSSIELDLHDISHPVRR
jgi:hypothetical protein